MLPPTTLVTDTRDAQTNDNGNPPNSGARGQPGKAMSNRPSSKMSQQS